MSQAIIFGAGKWGSHAKIFYEDRCEIIGFTDNNERLWNTCKDGLPVMSPKILREKNKDLTVIIANYAHAEEIRKQVTECYGIQKIVIFRLEISETVRFYPRTLPGLDTEDELIISFMGGLGNQMFQYAMLKYLETAGKKTSADFSWYTVPGCQFHETMIWDVFPKLPLPYSHPDKVSEYRKSGNVYVESASEHGNGELIRHVSECRKGIWEGYFQVASMIASVSESLKQDFCFEVDEELEQKKKCLSEKITVSVHIRRGDYLNQENDSLNVCGKEYYHTAMKMMEEKLGDFEWVFFSDDINWVKKHFKSDHAIFIEASDFSRYENWYDMYLMSRCRHHIISNSSFSWWAAWMNEGIDKIVIAPKTWSKKCLFPDICPKDWIRI